MSCCIVGVILYISLHLILAFSIRGEAGYEIAFPIAHFSVYRSGLE
jgi:hypothetical protein